MNNLQQKCGKLGEPKNKQSILCFRTSLVGQFIIYFINNNLFYYSFLIYIQNKFSSPCVARVAYTSYHQWRAWLLIHSGIALQHIPSTICDIIMWGHVEGEREWTKRSAPSFLSAIHFFCDVNDDFSLLWRACLSNHCLHWFCRCMCSRNLVGFDFTWIFFLKCETARAYPTKTVFPPPTTCLRPPKCMPPNSVSSGLGRWTFFVQP